jgi:hypothetical protein
MYAWFLKKNQKKFPRKTFQGQARINKTLAHERILVKAIELS